MSFDSVLVLLAAVAVVSGAARRFGASPPVALVLAGLVAGFVPGVPDFELDPELVLVLVLPPLLYSAALSTAYADFRDNLVPIGMLSVGLVLVTTAAVGVVAHLVTPGLSLPVALALGAIVAPPDAIAATAVARRLGLPRRLLTILEGESLLNDATALVALRVAVAAALVGDASWTGALEAFVVAAAGGALIGLVLGRLIAALRRRLDDPLLENALSLLTPFAAFLPAEAVHASGVLAVVVVGLYVGRRSPTLLSSSTRLQRQALWSMITFLLESLVFALIGLQLPAILDGLAGQSVAGLATTAGAVTAAVVLTRFLWMFPAAHLPPLLGRRMRERVPAPSWQGIVLLSWAGMRGVVSLAAAFALPLDVPGRDLVLFVTFCVILTTLLLQGLTLPWLVRRLGLDDAGATEQAERDVAVADHHVARVAFKELEELTEQERPAPAVIDELRGHLEERVRRAHAVLGGCPGEHEYDDAAHLDGAAVLHDARTTVQLRQQLLRAERAELLRLYDARDIDDEVLRRMQHQLDVEEARMQV